MWHLIWLDSGVQMAKRRYAVTEARIQKKLAEGLGTGSFADYKPWLRIHDFPSLGRVHRVMGMKAGRIHHLMSDLEYGYFTMCDYDDSVRDVREQFPLDRDRTYQIARELGIRHPTTTDGTPSVFTTDFLLVAQENGARQLCARAVKPSSELGKPRVLEKLEIERRYWMAQGVDWALITEEDIHVVAVRNIAVLRSHYDRTLICGLSESVVEAVYRHLLATIGNTDELLGNACARIDRDAGLETGTALAATYHLLAHKRLLLDVFALSPLGKHPLSKLLSPQA